MRLYEMFMGPLEAVKPWSTTGVDGVRRFLDRAWRLYVDEETDACLVTDDAPSTEALRALHKCIRKVTEDLDGMRFNTAISAMMELVNFMTPRTERPRVVMEAFARLLAPFAPHAGEELWARMGHGQTLAYEPWPKWDAALVQADAVTYAVQVNGKLRGQVELPVDVTQEAAIAAARDLQNVARFLAEGEVKKTVFVKGRMVNFVVAGA
jgi:leucyl-tRNA synthetase